MKDYDWLERHYVFVANNYMSAFCEMMKAEGVEISDALWIHGEIGGIMVFGGNYFLTYAELRYVVHNHLTYTQVTRWLDHCIEMHEYGLTPPSLEDWHNGKSTISMEKLERIRELKRQFDECVESVREEY